ncbi:Transcription elongation factor A protein 1 [Anabarilius grahami]|uniref:Transcription elongation factor A protein 1 n=1 Tax=Anabarilius grahami TaxID=495550 RepID=A0A3N0YFP7_ANAGA|nr:Transcription elongation factor A protein 1 [Anabarilius grahami]
MRVLIFSINVVWALRRWTLLVNGLISNVWAFHRNAFLPELLRSPPVECSSSNSSSKSESADVTPNTLIATFPRAPGTSDSVRIKCREMLSSALQTGGKS